MRDFHEISIFSLKNRSEVTHCDNHLATNSARCLDCHNPHDFFGSPNILTSSLPVLAKMCLLKTENGNLSSILQGSRVAGGKGHADFSGEMRSNPVFIAKSVH